MMYAEMRNRVVEMIVESGGCIEVTYKYMLIV